MEKYGLVAFAAAIIAYCDIITDYGFSLSATRRVSVHRSDRAVLNEIFSAVMTIKFSLLVLTFAGLLVVVGLVPRLREDALIYIFSFGVVVGNVLFPTWLFQGLERMVPIAVFNFLARLLFLGSIFVFVREEADYILIPALTSLGYIFSGIFALGLARKQFHIRFILPAHSQLRAEWREGWNIFTSRIYLNLYTTTNTVLLGFLTTNAAVGYYSVASRILKAANGIFEAANQAIYPRISQLATLDTARFGSALRRIGALFVLGGVMSFVLITALREPITALLLGEPDRQLTVVLVILLVQLCWKPLGALFTNALVSAGRSDVVSRILFFGAIWNLVLAPPAIIVAGVNGLAIAVVVVSAGVIFVCGMRVRMLLGWQATASTAL